MVVVAVGTLVPLACRPIGRKPPPPAPRTAVLAAPAPASELGATCADVGSLRVCWEGAEVRAEPRPAPAAPAPMGWRCVGRGPARMCRARSAEAPPFACDGARCEQRHPRMPDDGEWQCADSAGVTVCAGGERAAGVAPAPVDPGWFCGARAGGEPGRICVDLAPDFPDGTASGWRCTTRYDGPVRRACDRDASARTVGEPCDARRPCVDGALCAGGWCVPRLPAPACWLERDCAGGRCRFGSCLEPGA
jgi:hypothetical protein